jgi:hypothetical protein
MNRLQQTRNYTSGFCREYRKTDDLQGSGLISWIKNKKRKATKKMLENRPKIIDDIIEKEGLNLITKIEVCRNPISSVFSKTLNILTLGRLEREMKKKGYDKLYHLYMVIYLSNGKVYSFEKNQRINIEEGKKLKPTGECAPSLKYGKMSLKEFLLIADSKNIAGFYRYNAFKDNCQKWIYDMMNSNGISQFNSFILQDVSTLAPSYLEFMARKITDVAGIIDYKIRGGEYSE